MDLVTTVQLLGNLGESIAAIAVVATLFYLALQVLEGKKAAEANTLNGLEPIHRAGYVLYLRLGQWHMDSLFQLHEAGLLDDETRDSSFSGVEGILETWTALDDAGMAQPFRPSFRREIERKLAASRSGSGPWGVMGVSPTPMS